MLRKSIIPLQSLKINLHRLFINTESLINSCDTNASNIPFIKVYRCYVKMLFVEIWFACLYNKYVNNNYVLKTHILDTGDTQYLL